jgi:hypothetical protein
MVAWLMLWACRTLALVFLARGIGDFRLAGLSIGILNALFPQKGKYC